MNLTKAQRRKHAESFFFERAQGLLTCWPMGTIDATGEEPDIVVIGPNARYGVEVTEMLRDSVRAIEETRRLICEKAQKLFLRSLNADCLDVKVIFRDHAKLNPRVQEVAATDLAAIVRSRIPSIPAGVQAFRLEEGTDFESSLFTSVWLHHHPNYTQSRWQPVGAWWVPVASPADVQTTLDRKEGKIAAYRTRVEEVWLLIVLQGFSGSASWSVNDAVFSHQFMTSFDGVVLLDYAMNRAHVLAGKRPA
ncbi:hypothetical protein [Paraburkholderia fungorum]|uniref:hypothetical protein n=1 Tax=Paraburkholderia fungorum TaxID=134537 RepID=UPI002098241D|nr:hypothetical protein [Paraburkholderia fungorum]USX08226.1 hypothetical protein NHH62_37355 [Paraburkholderia fungorum]